MTGEVTRVEKPWGYELLFARTSCYAGKILCIRAGHRLSLQGFAGRPRRIYLPVTVSTTQARPPRRPGVAVEAACSEVAAPEIPGLLLIGSTGRFLPA